MKPFSLLILICSFNFIFEANGQYKYPPNIKEAKKVNYKTVDQTQLNLWIFNPENHKSTDAAPAIVFFFGGGWRNGNPLQFVKQSEYLASRGMVAIVADYRVKSRHNVLAKECVTDAKSAIRWVRKNALELGIDGNKIAAGGGSAGGHLAAASAFLPRFDDKIEDKTISSKPNALVLFNPPLLLAPLEELSKEINNRLKALRGRFGTDPVFMSPYHHMSRNMPPTIIFHGTDDEVVPFWSAEMFNKKMHEFENKSILIGYKGEGHGFFNKGKKSNALLIDTLNKMDQFLVSLGYLTAPPEVVIYKN